MAGSLTVVLGLFFLLTWIMRRGMPASTTRLPDDVVSVLGRAPLAGRQQVHVIRFGNKLLLVCSSTSGFDKLAEITEPEEVQRIVGLCGRSDPGAATVTAASRILGRLVAGGSMGKSRRDSPRLRIQNESARAKEAADAYALTLLVALRFALSLFRSRDFARRFRIAGLVLAAFCGGPEIALAQEHPLPNTPAMTEQAGSRRTAATRN